MTEAAERPRGARELCDYLVRGLVDDPDAVEAAYTTDDEYHWVCKGCFEDFKAQFGWIVAGAD